MGLTLHYHLTLKNGSAVEARALVESLRLHALSLPFASVSEMVELEGEDCRLNPKKGEDPHAWLKVQAIRFLTHEKDDVISAAESRPFHIIAFTVNPGEGSEHANFGLCRYPGEISGWSWSSFCKTQYASNPSVGDVANFLKCHLGLISVLDKARELGILGSVVDEGKYWENRDIPALVKEVGMWNRMIAGFYGDIRDAVEAAGGDPRSVAAEITKFKDFERLEAEGRKPLK